MTASPQHMPDLVILMIWVNMDSSIKRDFNVSNILRKFLGSLGEKKMETFLFYMFY